MLLNYLQQAAWRPGGGRGFHPPTQITRKTIKMLSLPLPSSLQLSSPCRNLRTQHPQHQVESAATRKAK